MSSHDYSKGEMNMSTPIQKPSPVPRLQGMPMNSQKERNIVNQLYQIPAQPTTSSMVRSQQQQMHNLQVPVHQNHHIPHHNETHVQHQQQQPQMSQQEMYYHTQQQMHQQQQQQQQNQIISQQSQQMHGIQSSQSKANQYGLQLSASAMLKAQQIQASNLVQDTDRSLQFEETDFENAKQNVMMGSDISTDSIHHPNNNNNTHQYTQQGDFNQNFKSPPTKNSSNHQYLTAAPTNQTATAANANASKSHYPVKRIAMPSLVTGGMVAGSPVNLRSSHSPIGVSQMLASGFSKFQSPRRSPRLLSKENGSQLSGSFAAIDSALSLQQPSKPVEATSNFHAHPLTTREEQQPKGPQEMLSQYGGAYNLTTREEYGRTKNNSGIPDTISSSGSTSSRLFQTAIRLDSELKKVRNEPLRNSSRDFGEKSLLHFHHSGQGSEQFVQNPLSASVNTEDSSVSTNVLMPNGSHAQNNLTSRSDSNLLNLHHASEQEIKEIMSSSTNVEELILQNRQMKKELRDMKKYKILASQSVVVQQINKDLQRRQEVLANDNSDLQEQLMDLQGQLQQLHTDYSELIESSQAMQKQDQAFHNSSMNALILEKAEAEKSIDHLTLLVNQRDAEIDSLRKDLKDSQELAERQLKDDSEAQRLMHVINELTNQLRDIQSEKLSLVDTIEGLHKDILNLSTENRSLSKTQKETITLLDERTDKLTAIKTQFDSMIVENSKFKEDSIAFKKQLDKLSEGMQVFTLIKSSDEESVFKMSCVLILRKNTFDKYLVHLETVQETVMVYAIDILELVPQKSTSSHSFLITYRDENNTKRNALLEAVSRAEMVTVCKAIKAFLISAQQANRSLLSTGSTSSRRLKTSASMNGGDSQSKDFISSISTFFGS